MSFLTLSGTSPPLPERSKLMGKSLKGLFVGSIATISLVWNVQIRRPLLLFVTSWHSLEVHKPLVISFCCMFCKLISCREDSKHSGWPLSRLTRTFQIMTSCCIGDPQFSSCPVLTLTLGPRNSQFQCAIHDVPRWSEGKARKDIGHLGSQRNASFSEKTVENR